MKYPVIYALEPIGVDGANEAPSAHPFCSIACRDEGNPVDGKHAIDHDGAFTYGEEEPQAEGVQCEACGKVLESEMHHSPPYPPGTIVTRDMVYIPWSNGYAVGFRCESAGGDTTSYVYLNPSSEYEGAADVFLYTGTHGDPAQDNAECFVNP